VVVLGVATIVTLRSAGLMQDEGALLAYADRVLHGAVAHRDFETYYGPGMPWVLAGAFLIAGHQVVVERLVGVLLEIVLAVTMASIGLCYGVRRGIAAGLLAAAVLVCVTPPIASPFLAASALVVVSLRVAAVTDFSRRRPTLRYAAAGVFAALAITFRIDFAVAVAVSIAPLLAGRWRMIPWYLGGLAAGLVPLAVHVVIAGPGTVFRLVFNDALRASGARTLPVPPSDPASRLEFAVLVVAIVADVAGAAVLWRRVGPSGGTRLAAAGALLSAATLVDILHRADEYHIVPAMVVAVALLGVTVPILLERHGLPRVRVRPAVAMAACGAAVLVGAAHLLMEQTAGVEVVNAGRSFPLLPGDAAEAQATLDDVDRIARSGQRVFVGPMDMRRTNYTATYMYFLLPQLVPATYYEEMEPLTDNLPPSHLAADVAGADVLVLTTKWDAWSEPNQSTTVYGSDLPNQVVSRLFCLRARAGTFSVFTRCDARG
jgi:hypothetical protein